jgi:hypothetical protein
MRRLVCLLAILVLAVTAVAAPTPAPGALERGKLVRVTRDQMMLFYGKPWRVAKKGEVFEVLDVRPATGQVFVATKDKGRLIAVALPIQNVILDTAAKKIERVEESAALFAGLIPRLNLRIAPEAVEQLRKEPRKYVEAVIEEEGAKNYEKVAIKLKGSAGSFRGIDDRPGFSINCTKYDGADRFHGLKRFQLNNCAQDGTALNELVTGEMARAAGVPASRCTHALVSLNGRDLGSYVLKEGFTEEFLAAFFKNTGGHLYDGGFCAEINEKMEVDRGDEKEKARLLELVGAMNEPDPAKQFARLSAVVDIDAYLRYLAMENIFVHWDGYSFNRNNYRIYENPETGKFHFILHGMDQMFGDPNASIQREPAGNVGAILWRRAEIRDRYFEVLTQIFQKVIKPVDWPARVEEHGRRLLASVAAAKPELAKNYEPQIAGARSRVADRLKQVQRLIEAPRLVNTLATKGVVELGAAEWTAQAQNAEANEATENGRRCLRLRATGEASASWRTGIAVPAGKFRFEAKARTIGVDPLPGESGDGAGLRISGGTRKGQKSLSGDAPWQPVSYEFESAGGDVVLVIELRAKAGELWVDRQSLRVVRAR